MATESPSGRFEQKLHLMSSGLGLLVDGSAQINKTLRCAELIVGDSRITSAPAPLVPHYYVDRNVQLLRHGGLEAYCLVLQVSKPSGYRLQRANIDYRLPLGEGRCRVRLWHLQGFRLVAQAETPSEAPAWRAPASLQLAIEPPAAQSSDIATYELQVAAAPEAALPMIQVLSLTLELAPIAAAV